MERGVREEEDELSADDSVTTEGMIFDNEVRSASRQSVYFKILLNISRDSKLSLPSNLAARERKRQI